MMAQGPRTGLGPLIGAKVICCGGFVLAATGALSGFGAWLAAGGYLWIGAAAGAGLVGLALLRRRLGGAGLTRLSRQTR